MNLAKHIKASHLLVSVLDWDHLGSELENLAKVLGFQDVLTSSY